MKGCSCPFERLQFLFQSDTRWGEDGTCCVSLRGALHQGTRFPSESSAQGRAGGGCFLQGQLGVSVIPPWSAPIAEPWQGWCLQDARTEGLNAEAQTSPSFAVMPMYGRSRAEDLPRWLQPRSDSASIPPASEWIRREGE